MDKKSVLKMMREKKLDLIISASISMPDPNFIYLSGIKRGTFEHSLLFFWKDGKRIILTSPLEEQLVKKQVDFKVMVYSRGRCKASDMIRRIVASRRAKRIGVSKAYLGVYDFGFLKKHLKGKAFVDVSKELAGTRMIKTGDEIRSISKACRITSKVARELPRIVKAGMTEKQVLAEIEKRMSEYGGDGLAFPTIVASGPNSAAPHHVTGDRRIRKGDFVMIDFGCKTDKYCSDMTRTLVVGKPSERQRKLYETCNRIQAECIKMVKEGVAADRIGKRADGMMEEYGKMIHGLGHGMGIKIHERPAIGVASKGKLKAGMVITIEPGIYIKNFGGARIEDDVLVTKEGCRMLTNAPRRLIEI
jgi:Xaa-Pro aminopeptidase